MRLQDRTLFPFFTEWYVAVVNKAVDTTYAKFKERIGRAIDSMYDKIGMDREFLESKSKRFRSELGIAIVPGAALPPRPGEEDVKSVMRDYFSFVNYDGNFDSPDGVI